MQIAWWFILAFSILLAVFLVAFALPKIIFKPGYDILSSNDRGLKNFKERNGRSVVYEPKKEYQKYISRYILSDRNGKKILLVRLNENITYLDYDITLFDCHNKVFKIINIKENIEKPGYTQILELPVHTSYASVILNCANNVKVNHTQKKRILGRRQALFAFVCTAIVILEMFLVKLCIANLFGDVFAAAFLNSAGGNFVTFLIGLAAASANLLFVFLRAKLAKNTGGERKYGL